MYSLCLLLSFSIMFVRLTNVFAKDSIIFYGVNVPKLSHFTNDE